MTEHVRVSFAGEGSGVDDLTWGQLGLWQAIAADGVSRTMAGVDELPPGTTVEMAAETLRFVMSRHQSLRSRLRFDGGALPKQVCSESGEVTLEIVDACDADPAEVADQVRERYQGTNFDYENEWPVRMAVVRKDGGLTHAVVVYLHLVIDANGLSALLADLRHLTPGWERTAPPVTAASPLDQARHQRGTAARRQGVASLRHLENVMRSVPISRFGEPLHTGEPTYRMIRFTSPATRLAVQVVAARNDINTSPVLLAAFAVTLARFNGRNPVMAMLMVGNRFRPGFGDSVSSVAQISPYLIDVADITLNEAVVRASHSAMNAYKHAYYDPYEQDDVVERINAERGEEVDFSCFYNDRRQQARYGDGPLPTAARIRDALPLSSHHWEDEVGMPRQKLYLHVDDAADAAGPADAIEFVMSADDRYLSREDMLTVVRGIEAVAVEAALDPLAATGVTAGELAVVGREAG